jgi:hypothetical protein
MELTFSRDVAGDVVAVVAAASRGSVEGTAQARAIDAQRRLRQAAFFLVESHVLRNYNQTNQHRSAAVQSNGTYYRSSLYLLQLSTCVVYLILVVLVVEPLLFVNAFDSRASRRHGLAAGIDRSGRFHQAVDGPKITLNQKGNVNAFLGLKLWHVFRGVRRSWGVWGVHGTPL